MTFLTIGILLGLSAGFSPGPILTLVISETLQHDIKSGVKVALAPVITDLPIIIVTLWFVTQIAHFNIILGIISLVGGCVILVMGFQSIRIKEVTLGLQEVKSNPFTKGILVNVLSPHPYLFWLSVGAPIVTKAMNDSIFAPLAFISSFYVLLVGSKIILAMAVGKSKTFLAGHFYIYTIRFLGIVLCFFAIILFRDGLQLLNVI